MVLSPQDIHDKEFTVKMRGYSIDEVNDFLDQIIKDYQITIKQNNDLRSALTDTQSKLKHFNSLKDSLNQSILVAQKAADRVKRDAETHRDKVVSEANDKASKILDDAKKQSDEQIKESNGQIDKLLVESQEIKKRTVSFRKKIQSMLESQLEFTKNATWDELLKPTADDRRATERVTNELDNQQLSRVKSNKSGNKNNSKVVTFYPDGSTK